MKYVIVVQKTTADFKKYVNKRIDEGYKPIGSAQWSGGAWSQSMLREEIELTDVDRLTQKRDVLLLKAEIKELTDDKKPKKASKGK